MKSWNVKKLVRDMQRDKFGPEGAFSENDRTWSNPSRNVFMLLLRPMRRTAASILFSIKAGKSGLIFSNAEYDKTEDIIRLLSK